MYNAIQLPNQKYVLNGPQDEFHVNDIGEKFIYGITSNLIKVKLYKITENTWKVEIAKKRYDLSENPFSLNPLTYPTAVYINTGSRRIIGRINLPEWDIDDAGKQFRWVGGHANWIKRYADGSLFFQSGTNANNISSDCKSCLECKRCKIYPKCEEKCVTCKICIDWPNCSGFLAVKARKKENVIENKHQAKIIFSNTTAKKIEKFKKLLNPSIYEIINNNAKLNMATTSAVLNKRLSEFRRKCGNSEDEKKIEIKHPLQSNSYKSFKQFTASLGGVIYLSQKDFDSGSYRIRKSGKYVLQQDIVFNPKLELESKRTDLPTNYLLDLFGIQVGSRYGIPWFCGISIESGDVELDMNGFSISCGNEFLLKSYFKTFSIILDGNSPYPTTDFHLLHYSGDSIYSTANSIVLKNGMCRESPQYGIYFVGNCNFVELSNIKIGSCESGGILINGGYDSLKMNNIEIDGAITHNIYDNRRLGNLMYTSDLLDVLSKVLPKAPQPFGVGSDEDAIAISAIVHEELKTNSKTIKSIKNPNVTQFGIIIRVTPDENILYPTSDDINYLTSKYVINKPHNITLKKIKITNLSVIFTETPLLSDKNNQPINPQQLGLLIRCIPYNEISEHIPSICVLATLFCMNSLENILGIKVLPKNFANNFLQHIYFGSKTAIDINLYKPTHGYDINGNWLRGIICLGLFEGTDVNIHDLEIENINLKANNINLNIFGVLLSSSTIVAINNYTITNVKSCVSECYLIKLLNDCNDVTLNNLSYDNNKSNKFITQIENKDEIEFTTTHRQITQLNYKNDKITCYSSK